MNSLYTNSEGVNVEKTKLELGSKHVLFR